MIEKEAECPYNTPPADIEESVSDRNDEKYQKIDEERQAEFLDHNSPVHMEEGVKDINDDRNKNMMMKKRHNYQMTLILFRWRKV